MLHAKFQDHRTFGSGEEDFLRFLPYELRHEKTNILHMLKQRRRSASR